MLTRQLVKPSAFIVRQSMATDCSVLLAKKYTCFSTTTTELLATMDPARFQQHYVSCLFVYTIISAAHVNTRLYEVQSKQSTLTFAWQSPDRWLCPRVGMNAGQRYIHGHSRHPAITCLQHTIDCWQTPSSPSTQHIHNSTNRHSPGTPALAGIPQK